MWSCRAQQQPRSLAVLVSLIFLAVLAAGCVVEETDSIPLPTEQPNTEVPEVPTPVFEPTATPVPAPATPTPLPPTATPVPAPPTPEATPLPNSEPAPEVDRIGPLQGLLVVPIAGRTSFMLTEPRELVQLPGHTLVYLPEGTGAEVDIFTPVAAADGRTLNTIGDVVIELTTTAVFEGMSELAPVTVAGHPTRVFEGELSQSERGFYTDAAYVSDPNAGWFPPTQIRMWLIDTPQGVVAVTAEALAGSENYSDAIRLATGILATITFSS